MKTASKLVEVLTATERQTPLQMPWPMPGNIGGVVSFTTFSDWHSAVRNFSLDSAIPQVVTTKFERAQKLYLLAWVDFDLVKAGELVALTALELALRDRYGANVKKKSKGASLHKPIEHAPLHKLLEYMVTKNGLSDEKIGLSQRTGGPVVSLLTGEDGYGQRLSKIRNGLAHGDPFDTLPWGGLLELVCNLIEYAYRNMIAEARTNIPNTPIEPS